ncbi:DNA translocase FtsK [Actinomadura sp. NPDC049382]|uniref:DNA translocase FtsK n=1 Tax=Actinomadura sp. NPDC049382 TaxID=3158220 RepID=UPI0034341437
MTDLRKVDVGSDRSLFLDAARMAIHWQRASADLIQRRVRVGFVKAGRLLDLLEDAGVVGAANGRPYGQREVLVPRGERDAALAELRELTKGSADV